ncbi:hypothetical protein JCM10908_005947 [Rhodotorula pacifica]|uniref:uncharacterized protein n=1 Tax=Rhodotorula pacifica TaxID=1495444 RepID=UPI00316EA9B1
MPNWTVFGSRLQLEYAASIELSLLHHRPAGDTLRMAETSHQTVAYSTCKQVLNTEVQSLTALAVAPPGLYRAHRCDTVVGLSKSQGTAVTSLTRAWTASLNTLVSSLVHAADVIKVTNWIMSKRIVCEKALRDKTILHFDMLVLNIGIGPLEQNALSLADTPLQNARQWLSKPNTKDRTGYATQIKLTMDGVLLLVDRAPASAISSADKQYATAWYKSAGEVMSAQAFDNLALLGQYGVKELLFLLYTVLKDLFAAKKYEKAFKVLRYWTPERILARINITLRVATDCTQPINGSGSSLEAVTSAATPQYCRPLPLPPFTGTVSSRDASTHNAELGEFLSGPENHEHDLHALGTGPRIGRRAARRYGVDAAAWAREARQRHRSL